MTAEIAILNRSALALAADSAVTITVGRKNKVYDTAEKLFEFSRKQPIALMIYNNVEYVGVPLDVLIRKFRTAHDEPIRPAKYKPFATLKDAADQFLEYLRGFDHDLEEEEKHLYFALRERLRPVARVAAGEIQDTLFKGMMAGKTPTISPADIATKHIKQAIEHEKLNLLPGYLSDVTLTKFRARFGESIKRLAADLFKGIVQKPSLISACVRLGYHVMKSCEPSEMVTGLVFGGFATKDMFPTLHYLEMDGIYFGQIKITSRNEVDIDRRRTRAEVVPFAQKEMVERFMYGLDTDLESDIHTFVDNAIDQTLSASGKLTDKAKASAKLKIANTFGGMIGNLKERSRQDLLDIVYFMSKKELADIAYALVELTSQKRRFSTEEQSVGGPIDVAILTKSEGLVWIKRKHYFGPETNQGYYSRVFGRLIGGSHEE